MRKDKHQAVLPGWNEGSKRAPFRPNFSSSFGCNSIPFPGQKKKMRTIFVTNQLKVWRLLVKMTIAWWSNLHLPQLLTMSRGIDFAIVGAFCKAMAVESLLGEGIQLECDTILLLDMFWGVHALVRKELSTFSEIRARTCGLPQVNQFIYIKTSLGQWAGGRHCVANGLGLSWINERKTTQ